MTYTQLYQYLIVLFFIGFLYFIEPIGVDWPAYKSIRIDYGRFYFLREPLGWLLPSIFRDLENGNYYTGVIISSILIMGTSGVLNTINSSYRINLIITLILTFSNFYLLLSVNGLRQGLAFGFLLYSLKFSLQHRFRNTTLFLTLAALSHNSAILLTPLLFFHRIRLSNKIKILSIIPILFLGPAINNIASKNSLLSVTNNSRIYLNISILLFLLSFFLRLKENKKGKDHYFIIAFYLLVMSLSFFSINSAYERLVYYIIPLQIIFTAPLLDYFKPKKLVYSILVLVLIMSVIYNLSHPSVQNNFLRL